MAFIGTPLWGLLSYQWNLLALVKIRVNSIKILEQKLLSKTSDLSDAEKNQIGSDAGDRISRLSRQPRALKYANAAAFWSIAVAASTVAITSIALVAHKDLLAFGFGMLAHVTLASAFIGAVTIMRHPEKLIDDIAAKGPYYDTYPSELSSQDAPSPPGWYFDHILLAGQRYWDGTAWTEHTAP